MGCCVDDVDAVGVFPLVESDVCTVSLVLSASNEKPVTVDQFVIIQFHFLVACSATNFILDEVMSFIDIGIARNFSYSYFLVQLDFRWKTQGQEWCLFFVILR